MLIKCIKVLQRKARRLRRRTDDEEIEDDLKSKYYPSYLNNYRVEKIKFENDPANKVSFSDFGGIAVRYMVSFVGL